MRGIVKSSDETQVAFEWSGGGSPLIIVERNGVPGGRTDWQAPLGAI
jgi:hypothetical protein